MTILGGAYLLQPYYSIIAKLHIPSLWEREVIVLPFIILIIFIRRCLKGRYSDITKAVQWGVLIIVSLLLIQDGLASNTIYDALILGTLSLLSHAFRHVPANKVLLLCWSRGIIIKCVPAN